MVIPKKERPPMLFDDQDLLRRAFAAYFRKGRHDQPAEDSEVFAHDDKLYVILRNVRGILEVYRVRNDGMLKSLKRIPKAISERYE
jgi:hypothetical protein